MKFKHTTAIVDLETGELHVVNPPGTNYTCRTNEALEMAAKHAAADNIKKAKQKKKSGASNTYYKKYGGFIWCIYEGAGVLFPTMKPQTLTRVMYLSTYVNYTGELVDKTGRLLKRDEVRKLLAIGEASFERFLRETRDLGIMKYQDSRFSFNEAIFKKGPIENLNSIILERSDSITRIYIDGVRALYQKALGGSLQRLSYLFRIMPFVNKEYNIVCSNPLEKRKKNINPLSMGDVAELVGYGSSNAKKFQALLLDPVFNIDGEFTRALRYVSGDRLGVENHCLFINPKVYYGGSKHEEVAILGQFS